MDWKAQVDEAIKRFRNGFPTGSDFTAVENLLQTLCDENKIRNEGLDPDTSQYWAILYSAEEEEKKMRLKIPDHAYRGGVEWL